LNELAGQVESFVLSIAIGLLMGLERERRPNSRAGLRTFALVAVLGCLAAMLGGPAASNWLLAAGLLVVGAMIITAYAQYPDPEEPGTTSVAALLVCYGLGALIWYGHPRLAVMIGIASTVLLYFKTELKGIASRLAPRDYSSMLQFGVLSLIVLPILPDQNFGPYGAFNPYLIWLMVVLVSGVSLAGYAALRLVGAEHGAPVIGLFGGLVSSTATTMVFARHARSNPALGTTAAVVILLANMVMMLRVAAIVVALAPALWRDIALVLGPSALLGLAAAGFGWRRMHRSGGLPLPEVRNPTEIRAALGFGLLYAAVLFLAAWLSDVAGDRGLFVVALVSGLTDVDAITLSSLRLFSLDKLPAAQTLTAIALAILASLAFKTGLAGIVGGAGLARSVLPGMMAVGAGIGAALLWLHSAA
jgi:uncharacterized membrane protein (DUF4010 family)